MELYPMELQSAYQSYLWGGDRIRQLFDRPVSGVIAESWELSDRKEGVSTIANGPYQGKSLADLIDQYGASILGIDQKKAPLLIKLLDANKDLSIQVHPDDQDAARMNAEPKTEAWVVIDAAPGAYVLAGFSRAVDPQEVKQAILDQTLETMMHRIEVKIGDVIFVPAGLIHAIGVGCVIFEVQQNSNTTYRVYDYGRKDAQGKQRDLHIEEAMETTHFDKGPASIQPRKELDSLEGFVHYQLVTNPYFTIEELIITKEIAQRSKPNSFTYYFCKKGQGSFVVDHQTYPISFGKSYLIPADLSDWKIEPTAESLELLKVTL